MELTNEQRDDVRNFLISRGLAFKPLLDEMSDHVGCDLEERMNRGLTYEEAWKETIIHLPEDHFKLIQSETMETINRRFKLSRLFTYAGMAALLIATIFKVLHLRGASELTLFSFAALALALISGSVAGIYFDRDRKGAIRVLGIVGGAIMIMLGYTFKILHLSGADEILILAAVISAIFMFVNTISAYNSNPDTTSLFSSVHEKYSPGIERFLLILTVPMVIYSIVVMTLGTRTFVPFISIVVIFSAALHFFSLVWLRIEKEPTHKNSATLTLIVAAFACLIIPMLAEIVPFNIRLMAVACFTLFTALISWRLDSTRAVLVAPLLMIAIVFSKFSYLEWYREIFMIHVIVAIAMLALIFTTKKEHAVTKTFLVIFVMSYLLELT